MDQAFTEHTVTGGGGTALHVREWGNPTGQPILFIHGWSQSHLCWMHQYQSDLTNEFRLVALDNRGHGQSDKPMQIETYTDGKMWADDIAAVIDALGLTKPILAGWSYGGFIISDYVQTHGQDNLGGINFVAAAVIGPPTFTHIGPGFLENGPLMMSPDSAIAIAGTRRFVRACTAEALPAEIWDTMLCVNSLTPPKVREWCVSRQLDYTEVLKTIRVPTVVTIGMRDSIVLPAMGEHITATVPGAVASCYEHSAHAPFLEEASRFNQEIAEFARSVGQSKQVNL